MTAPRILGAALAQAVLRLFGIAIIEALWLNAVMIGLSYLRAFVIRRMFARIG